VCPLFLFPLFGYLLSTCVAGVGLSVLSFVSTLIVLIVADLPIPLVQRTPRPGLRAVGWTAVLLQPHGRTSVEKATILHVAAPPQYPAHRSKGTETKKPRYPQRERRARDCSAGRGCRSTIQSAGPPYAPPHCSHELRLQAYNEAQPSTPEAGVQTNQRHTPVRRRGRSAHPVSQSVHTIAHPPPNRPFSALTACSLSSSARRCAPPWPPGRRPPTHSPLPVGTRHRGLGGNG